jgi:hypothetical protein
MRQMFQMMNFARIGVGVQGLACASTAYLNALQYARERRQGAAIANAKDPRAPRVPILQHADIRRMLLDMKAKVEGMRAMVVKAAFHHDAATQTDDETQRSYHLGQVELLTPLVKAYCSDQGFRIAELAIQIYGGAGYTKDHPVEQYARDAKVFAIYEGTNHIQALDLVGRKLRLARGEYAKAFFADLSAFVKQHNAHPALGNEMQRLGAAAQALGALLLVLPGWETEQPERIALIASPLLELWSELCVGWMLLQAAVIADAKLADCSSEHPDHAFYTGKVHSARHFAHWVLATTAARAAVLAQAPATALQVPDAAFASV